MKSQKGGTIPWPFLACIALVVGSLKPSSLRSQDSTPDALDRILGDWKVRQERIASIEYKVSGTLFYPKGKFDLGYSSAERTRAILKRKGNIPPQDTTLPHKAAYLLELNQNWARKELQWMVLHESLADFVPHQTTEVFNGTTAKKFEPRAKNTSSKYTPSNAQPDLWIEGPAGNSPTFFQFEDLPVFWACGSVQRWGLVPGNLRPKYNRSVFTVTGGGEIEGKKCVVLRTVPADPISKPIREYWVDPSRQSAILRCVAYFEDKLEFKIDASYELQQGLWLPTAWKCIYYERDVLDRQFDLTADQISINPSVEASDFDVRMKPGMVVKDQEKKMHGVVDSDGRTLLPLTARPKPPGRAVRLTVSIALLAGVLGLGAWLLRRIWIQKVSRQT